jgi:hypothetical protein
MKSVDDQKIIDKLTIVLDAYKKGKLHTEKMPEDANPGLERNSRENVLYFTLPMALNYQRNSYSLWMSAYRAYNDVDRNYLFDPSICGHINIETIKKDLVFHKLALQPNKHPNIWLMLSQSFVELYQGDVRNLFELQDYDISKILHTIQITYKRHFPYLSGPKIANYWLYVLTQYTDLPFRNLQALSVAPDTHIIQSSIQLGLIEKGTSPLIVAQRWEEVLNGTGISPIQIHTPLWLWSRNNFQIST